MRYSYLAFLALLVAACADQTPVAPVEDGPAFNWMNNPGMLGNFKVYRSEGNMIACWTDPGNGLRACHATIPLGSGTEPDCGLQNPADPADWQQLLIDEDAFRVIANAVGDVFITVRDLNVAGACFDNATVAEGWGRMHLNDNDQFFSVVNNTNVWGFTAHGDLLTTAGDPVKYSGNARLAESSDKPFRVLSAQVNLH